MSRARAGCASATHGLTLQDVRIAGEDFLVLANARLRGEQVEGGLYAKYGVLSGGVELAGGAPSGGW